MPAICAHHNFAMSVLNSSPEHLKKVLSENDNAFIWGAQGPDILFFHLPPVCTLGSAMHKKKPYENFNALLDFIRDQKDSAMLSYLCGFACHYILDKNAHPFVNYMAEHKLKPNYDMDALSLHKLCESDLDALTIWKFICKDQKSFKAYNVLEFDQKIAKSIGKLFSATSKDLFDIKVSALNVRNSMRFMKVIARLIHSDKHKGVIQHIENLLSYPNGLSAMIRPENPLSEDCGNLNHDKWSDPCSPSIIRNDSFLDIYDHSIIEAIGFIQNIYDCYHLSKPLDHTFFKLNYDGIFLQ